LIVGSRHINQGSVGVAILSIGVPLRWPDKVVGASLDSPAHLNAITRLGSSCVLDHSDEIERNLVGVGAAQATDRNQKEKKKLGQPTEREREEEEENGRRDKGQVTNLEKRTEALIMLTFPEA
jgi:hypothetical protein